MSSAGAAMPLLAKSAGGINGDPLPAVSTQAPRKDLFFQAGGWTLATAGFATAGVVFRVSTGEWGTIPVSLFSVSAATGLSTLTAWYNVYKDRISASNQQTSMHTVTEAATATVWREATERLRSLVPGAPLAKDSSYAQVIGAVQAALAKPTFPDRSGEIADLQSQLGAMTHTVSVKQGENALLTKALEEGRAALEEIRATLQKAQRDLRVEKREHGTASTAKEELQEEVSQLGAKLVEKETELQGQRDRFALIGAGIRDVNGALSTMTRRMALSPDETFEGDPIAIFDLQTEHPLFSLGQAVNKLIKEVNLIHFSYDESTSTYSSRATTPGVTPIASPARAVTLGRRVRFALGLGDGAAAAASSTGLDSDGEE